MDENYTFLKSIFTWHDMIMKNEIRLRGFRIIFKRTYLIYNLPTLTTNGLISCEFELPFSFLRVCAMCKSSFISNKKLLIYWKKNENN